MKVVHLKNASDREQLIVVAMFFERFMYCNNQIHLSW